MMTPKELVQGDFVAILYGDVWLRGRVAYCEPDTWPLVRISDGQLTEVRPFMTWRLLQAAQALAA